MLTVVKNSQKHELTIMKNGQAYALPANEEKIISKELAEEFVRVYPQYVTFVNEDALGAVVTQEVKPSTIFLANMTGNPDAPEHIDVRFWNRQLRIPETRQQKNPRRVAVDVKNKMNGGMQEHDVAPDEPATASNLAGRWIVLPKYSIKEFPMAVGHWLLTRDYNLGPVLSGRVKISRKPPDFRPTLQWKLDEIRAYIKMTDKNAELGPTEGKLKLEHKNAQEFQEALDAAKLVAWKRAFFRIADPDYQLPTKEEFEAFVAAEQKQTAVDPNRAANAINK